MCLSVLNLLSVIRYVYVCVRVRVCLYIRRWIYLFLCIHTNGTHILKCLLFGPLQKIFAGVSCKKFIITVLTWGVAIKEL